MEAMGHEHVVEAMGHEHVVEAMGHEHVVEVGCVTGYQVIRVIRIFAKTYPFE